MTVFARPWESTSSSSSHFSSAASRSHQPSQLNGDQHLPHSRVFATPSTWQPHPAAPMWSTGNDDSGYNSSSKSSSATHSALLPLATNDDYSTASSTSSMLRCRPSTSAFSSTSISILESWYSANVAHPYPTDRTLSRLAEEAGLTIKQTRKWLANRRVRSYNTLTYNGSIHPRRLQSMVRRRQRQAAVASISSTSGLSSSVASGPSSSLTSTSSSVVLSPFQMGSTPASRPIQPHQQLSTCALSGVTPSPFGVPLPRAAIPPFQVASTPIDGQPPSSLFSPQLQSDSRVVRRCQRQPTVNNWQHFVDQQQTTWPTFY